MCSVVLRFSCLESLCLYVGSKFSAGNDSYFCSVHASYCIDNYSMSPQAIHIVPLVF